MLAEDATTLLDAGSAPNENNNLGYSVLNYVNDEIKELLVGSSLRLMM